MPDLNLGRLPTLVKLRLLREHLVNQQQLMKRMVLLLADPEKQTVSKKFLVKKWPHV